MEIVRTKDTGTRQYDIYFNDDRSECIVLERYRDSEALFERRGRVEGGPGALRNARERALAIGCMARRTNKVFAVPG
jgi:hypothetical protein